MNEITTTTTTTAPPELQSLQSLLTGGSPEQSQKFIDSVMPILQFAMVFGAIVSIIVVVYLIISMVQKHRVHTAILRIDKNLQKLVDVQVPAATPATTEVTEKPSETITTLATRGHHSESLHI